MWQRSSTSARRWSCSEAASLSRQHRGKVSAVLFLFMIVTATSDVNGAPRVEFLVDMSASMSDVVGGEAGHDLVRAAIRTAVEALPADMSAAVRVYGHRVERARRSESCRDTELVIPFTTGLTPAGLSPLDGLSPRGLTPLAQSLIAAGSDFPPGPDRRAIIVVTDGADTCDGDPVAAVKTLRARGLDVVVHTVGLNLTPGARSELSAIALAGGGTFQSVSDLAAMQRGLRRALAVSFDELSDLDVAGRGDLDTSRDAGDSPAEAMPLPAGREFGTNWVGDGDDRSDFFVIELRPGEKYHGVVRIDGAPPGTTVNLRTRSDAPVTSLARTDDRYEFDLLDIERDTQAVLEVSAARPISYRVQIIRLVGLPS